MRGDDAKTAAMNRIILVKFHANVRCKWMAIDDRKVTGPKFSLYLRSYRNMFGGFPSYGNGNNLQATSFHQILTEDFQYIKAAENTII